MKSFNLLEGLFFQGKSGESMPVKSLLTKRIYDTISVENIERSRFSADILPVHNIKASISQYRDDSNAKHDDKLPTFELKLSNITVNEGEDAEFSCTVSTVLFKFQKLVKLILKSVNKKLL